eukprot:g5155.t1
MVSERGFTRTRVTWSMVMLLILSLLKNTSCADDGGKRKLKYDELGMMDIARLTTEHDEKIESLKETLSRIESSLALLIVEKAAKEAAAKSETIRIDLDFASKTWNCFKQCLRLFLRGIYEAVLSIGEGLAHSWSKEDFMTRCILLFLLFHSLSTIKSMVHTLSWICSMIYKMMNVVGQLLRKSNTNGNIPVEDDISVYETLIQMRRYREEELGEFLNRIISKWKGLRPKLSKKRVLGIFKPHFPREFLQGLQDVDFDKASVEEIMRKWSNFNKWTRQAREQMPATRPKSQMNRNNSIQRPQFRCNHCGADHLTKDYTWPTSVKCHKCGKNGHIATACPLAKKDQQRVYATFLDNQSETSTHTTKMESTAECLRAVHKGNADYTAASAAKLYNKAHKMYDLIPIAAEAIGSTLETLVYSVVLVKSEDCKNDMLYLTSYVGATACFSGYDTDLGWSAPMSMSIMATQSLIGIVPKTANQSSNAVSSVVGFFGSVCAPHNKTDDTDADAEALCSACPDYCTTSGVYARATSAVECLLDQKENAVVVTDSSVFQNNASDQGLRLLCPYRLGCA